MSKGIEELTLIAKSEKAAAKRFNKATREVGGGGYFLSTLTTLRNQDFYSFQ